MNLAAIDWLRISINLLEVIFVIGCLLMILLILMQRPKQEGLGAAFGAGVTDQVFGARTTNVLQRGTVYLASMFFILALTLAVLIGHKNKQTSMLAPKKSIAQAEAAKLAAPKAPAPPKSLSTELPADTSTPSETPVAPPAKDAAPLPPAAPKEVPAVPAPVVPAAPTPVPAPATVPAAPQDKAATPPEKSAKP